MEYDEFLGSIEERAGTGDREDAERTAIAVLETLCDRLTGEEADQLLAQLPARLKQTVTVARGPMPLSRDEFVQRVSRRLGIQPEEALDRIRSVFATIREAVSRGELEDVVLQLEPEYADFLA
jgi:uncharacterized protein (DUF2267 family)